MSNTYAWRAANLNKMLAPLKQMGAEVRIDSLDNRISNLHVTVNEKHGEQNFFLDPFSCGMDVSGQCHTNQVRDYLGKQYPHTVPREAMTQAAAVFGPLGIFSLVAYLLM